MFAGKVIYNLIKQEINLGNDKESIFGKAMGLVIHDIRNYLNTIIGFSSILQNDTGLSNENKNFVLKISQAGSLIEKFLSGIDDYMAEDDEIEVSNVNVKETIDETIRSIEEFHNEKRIIIENMTNKDIKITTSKIIFNKIIENLYGFSIKGLRGKEDRFIQIYCDKKRNGFVLYYSDTSNPISIENNYFSFEDILNSKRSLYPLFIQKYVSMLGGKIKYLSGNKRDNKNKIFKGNHVFEISIPVFDL